jgi:diguanylate cyclase
VPDDDIVARIGGDEFLIVARSACPAEARAFGARLIAALSARSYVFGANGVEIGASIGIALSTEHGPAFSRLIEAADEALYLAKARGRCQCVVATSGPRLAAEHGRRTHAPGEAEGTEAA